MYVYQKSEDRNIWVVGFYSPSAGWMPIKYLDEELDAAYLVNYLNGGNGETHFVKELL